ncbi:carnitine dehydratase [Candidatus Bathyarchaeota archaeon]|nr:carnitine dehydratase [Candidatus Bathyarchaeota archaeon]MDP6048834.1 CoA transferase [Candidatus Bathyarchaeota archaeon]MDP7442776.1 CoA transferase [Candidatus Bathyarchaeota archaeon]
MSKILDDIRVADLSHVWFGPWCTMMLADLGAEVIKIEPPWGSIGRVARGPLFGGASTIFHHLNMNKMGISLNLKDPQGVDVFKDLIKISDVVVQNFAPGTMERLGLGYDVLTEINPKLIYAALSGFGQYGPYTSRPAYASIAEAMSGHTRLTGDGVDPKGPPIQIAQAYGDLGPGTMAAMSIIAAIRHRDRTGMGQMIDVAQLDCMLAYNTGITSYMLTGLRPHEIRKHYPRAHMIGGLKQAKDGGWVQIAGHRPKAIERLKVELGIDEVTQEILDKIIAGKTRDELVEYMARFGIPVAPVYDIPEIEEDPHVEAREMIIEVNHPKAGKIRSVNFPVKFSETPIDERRPAPVFGQHNAEVVKGLLGYSEERFQELKKTGIVFGE